MKLQDSTPDLPVVSPEVTGEAKLESHGIYRLGLAYARQVYRFRWLIIVLWLVGVAASVPFAVQLPAILSGGGYSLSSSESAHVNTIITDKLHQPPSSAMVVFQSSNTPVTDAAYQQEVNAFIARAQHFTDVSGVIQGGVGKDGYTTFVVVNFTQSDDNMTRYLNDFKKIVPSGAAASPARPYITGDVPVNADFTTITQSDVEHAETAALPIALVVLLI
ncbi:MAG TPA: MMPL family transporter, partial [Ktedonobacteraceae bacterium]|nr:MMPL family transporter [Ktedonobacteraceae bacterium]